MTVAIAAMLLVLSSQAPTQTREAPGDTSAPVLEIRSYNLKGGTRDNFHELFVREALPMLRQWNVDVVAYGPSRHDRDSYFLMRAFSSLEARERSEEAFYGSAEWLNGPRAAVLAAIDSYTTIVIRVDDATLGGLRRAMETQHAASDLDLLLKLNNDYIESVNTSNVKRFSEILAGDFLCSLPDGTLIDRAGFLERTAKPSGIVDLQAHDVNVRIMGDVAIVHARTTFTLPGGAPGSGRYTDVWARRNGTWVAVSAHVTRK
jgi:ketosteroid isomerase-like protein